MKELPSRISLAVACLWVCSCLCPTIMVKAADGHPLQEDDISKDLKREAKELSRQGWKPVPGTPPLVEQLRQVSSLPVQTAKDSTLHYMTATASAAAESIDKAKAIAMEYARQELASQIESQVDAITKIKTSNQQSDNGEIQSAAKKMTETKVSALQRIGRVKPLMQLYRILPDDNVEVQVRIAYNLNELIQKEE